MPDVNPIANSAKTISGGINSARDAGKELTKTINNSPLKSKYGIKNNDTKKFIDTADIIKSEEDIFKYLAIPYVPPNKRDMV